MDMKRSSCCMLYQSYEAHKKRPGSSKETLRAEEQESKSTTLAFAKSSREEPGGIVGPK